MSQGRVGGRGRTDLSVALELIAEGAVSVLSLDMFDTTVWRTVPRPTDAFVILGARLRAAGHLSPTVDPLTFRRLRMAAETAARVQRRNAGHGVEVTLSEIWAAFPRHLVDASDAHLAAAEIDVELEVVQPDQDIAEVVAAAVKAGLDLAVVSNTYLGRRDLLRLLGHRPALAPLVAGRLYPSCEYRVGKGEGLWPIVLDDLGVEPSQVLHIGDDALADVEIPGRLGVRTCWFERVPSGVQGCFERESTQPPVTVDPHPANVDPVGGDHGFTALRAKVAAPRANGTDRGSAPSDLQVAWNYGAAVFGPVMTGFSEWVHRRAADLGATSLWCPMREGETISAHLNAVPATEATARPIWLSRAATGRAAIRSVDRAALERLARTRVSPTVETYVTGLGLTVDEVPTLRGVLGRRMDAAGVGVDAISYLVETPTVRARIEEEAGAARQRLIRNLEETIGALTGTVVLVDLGWAGTIQHNLQQVLVASGADAVVQGFYLATNVGATDLVVGGDRIEGYLTSLGAPDGEGRLLNLYPHVFEQACLSSVGSLVDFDDDGRPVLDDSVPPPDQCAQTAALQDGARAFQQEWIRYRRPPLDGSEVPLLRRILSRSISTPTTDEARLFGAWTHFDNGGSSHRDAFVPDDWTALARYLSPPDLLALSAREVFWPLGLAAGADPDLLASAIALEDGTLPATAFDPTEPLVARFSVDCGPGFAPAGTAPVRINRHGLSFIRFAHVQPGITSVRLSISPSGDAATEGDAATDAASPTATDGDAAPTTPTDAATATAPGFTVLLRLDRLDLLLTVDGHPVERRRSLDCSTVSVVSGQTLAPGLAIGSAQAVTIEIPVSRYADGLIDRVEVRLGGAVTVVPEAMAAAGPDGRALGQARRPGDSDGHDRGPGDSDGGGRVGDLARAVGRRARRTIAR